MYNWLSWAAVIPWRQEKKLEGWTCSPMTAMSSTPTAFSFFYGQPGGLPVTDVSVSYVFFVPSQKQHQQKYTGRSYWAGSQCRFMSLGLGFFFVWVAFDLKTSFLSWMRCWSRDQGLAAVSCWLAPGRTFGQISVHVLGFCLFKIHLVLSSPWKLPLREIFGLFIF